MPWVKRQKPPHYCFPPLPRIRHVTEGDLWRCRKCKQLWMVGRVIETTYSRTVRWYEEEET